MIFTPLASSSKGNAYILSDGTTYLLLECGVTWKRLQQLAGFKISSIDGCLVSHEHNDHSACVDKVIKSGVLTYLSQGTAAALASGDKPKLSLDLVDMAEEMAAGKQFSVGSMQILPFETFHDVEEPLGFLIKSEADGDIFAFAIDTCNLPYNFPGVNILAVEANYDPGFFQWLDEKIDDDDSLDSVRRRQMRKRIKRTTCTHMSIDMLCDCLERMDLSRCREIWLMHLSDENSVERDFIKKVKAVVPPGCQVRACPR